MGEDKGWLFNGVKVIKFRVERYGGRIFFFGSVWKLFFLFKEKYFVFIIFSEVKKKKVEGLLY